ncbi:transmembrane protein, putative (macronuclear) [Tetrahymena thermophila SB210]|uniref:Transmembrane protein, putative n=1 Tax=Tetrahymena thermophila (strain SB210) TaxID=312017 RepID=W7XFA4_TETTS|nr:transmembrane protein, putative [Tetrahymena thermophila SB210]EWS71454.1 transmembrane protein, putative [Tetrahymena thermophila SB210]|eukprot:XP_012656020.1 transmembrane protein, putative [Tetrahymena thermophila SB210]
MFLIMLQSIFFLELAYERFSRIFNQLCKDQEQNDSSQSPNGKQRRQPWGILIFGMILASAFVGWVNIDRLKNKMNHKKKFGDENYDLVEIYELNPDYQARKRFEENLLKLKSHHTDFLSCKNAYKLGNNKQQEEANKDDEESTNLNKGQNEEVEISLQQIEKVQNSVTPNQNLEI